MNEIRQTNRLRTVALLGVILTVGILFMGCDDQRSTATERANPATGVETPDKQAETAKEDEAKALTVTAALAKTEETPTEASGSALSTPAATEPILSLHVSETDVLAAIDASANPFHLHALQQTYRQREEQSEVVNQALASKWKNLTKGMKPQPLIEGLDFLAVDTKATGDEEYTVSFLFAPTANWPAANHHLTVWAWILPSKAPYIRNDTSRVRPFWTWTLDLAEVPTSQWNPGDYRVVQVKPKVELNPYYLQFFLQTKDEQDKLVRAGEKLTLGWQWDVLDETSFLSKIEACNDFVTLYELAPAGPPMSARVAKAVEEKWKALTADMEPKTLLKGLDFLALDTKASGEREYTFSVLVRFTADVSFDHYLALFATMDASHVKPGKPQNFKWLLRQFGAVTMQWKAGEYYVAQRRIETEIVPYDIQIGLQRQNPDEGERYPGVRLELGWCADVYE